MTDYTQLAEDLLLILRHNSKLSYRRELAGFSHGELLILTYLTENEGGIYAGNLCEKLDMTTPRISAAISSLQKKGLVTKETDTADRRKVRIYITSDGLELISQKKAELTATIEQILRALGDEDAKEYVRITSRINALNLT